MFYLYAFAAFSCMRSVSGQNEFVVNILFFSFPAEQRPELLGIANTTRAGLPLISSVSSMNVFTSISFDIE